MHQTTLAWPCRLEPEADGRLPVRFTDIPEALTDGANEADALAEAIARRHADAEPIPTPSLVSRDGHLVPLDTLLAHKVALTEAMRAEGMSKVALAKELGVDEKSIQNPRRETGAKDVRNAVGVMHVHEPIYSTCRDESK